MVERCGVRKRGWIAAKKLGGRRPSRAIASRMRAWLSIITSSTLVMPATAPKEMMKVAIGEPEAREGVGDRRVDVDRGVRHHAGQHPGDRDVEHGAEAERHQDGDRHVALGIARLLGVGADRIEADVGEEDVGGALEGAADALLVVEERRASWRCRCGRTRRRSRTARSPSLRTTIAEFRPALSRMPITSTTVRSSDDHRRPGGRRRSGIGPRCQAPAITSGVALSGSMASAGGRWTSKRARKACR